MKVVVALILCNGLCATHGLTMRGSTGNKLDTDSELQHPAWLSKCKEFYLDVGSNIGVQVRKFFEPEKYPGAPAIAEYDKIFGDGPSRRKAAEAGELCVLGMEPSPHHQFRLQALQNFYQEKGWNVHFYPAAASTTSGKAHYDRDDSEGFGVVNDLGGHLATAVEKVKFNGKEDAGKYNVMDTVNTVDLAKFVKDLPKGSIKFMKMDIEGSEFDVLPKMLEHKLLCEDTVKALNIEVHKFGKAVEAWKGEQTMDGVQSRLNDQSCQPSKLLTFDDEYYPQDETNKDMEIAEQRLREKKA